MKKIVVTMVLLLSILSACTSPEMSLKKVDKVPDSVQERIDPTLRLQAINKSENEYYIVFQTVGDVKADYDKNGDTLIVKFDVPDSQGKEEKQNVFLLTTDQDIEIIEVLINGEATPFDLAG